VAQAFQHGRDEPEVLEIVREMFDAGVDADELAAALWVRERWR
jgi:hypothetical protein